MLIHLNEVPQEGKTWNFSRQSGELNEILHDLIGTYDFHVEVQIKPLSAQGTFELRGNISTELPEQCSRCGQDFRFGIKQKINHLLMPNLSAPRDAKYAKANHLSDMQEGELDVVEYHGTQFNVGEFAHEFIALAEPFNPAPLCDAQGNCVECKISVKNQQFGYDEEMPGQAPPFTQLQDQLKGLLKGLKS